VTPCTLEAIVEPDVPRDVTLCPGTTTFVVTIDEGARLDVTVELADVKRASVELRSPDDYYLDGPTWRPTSIEAGAIVTISGEQRIRIEADAQLDARITAHVTPPVGRVLHLAPFGSDTSDGSVAAPWQTWPVALARLVPGDTVIVHDGTWSETTCDALAQPCLAGAMMPIVGCPDQAANGTPGFPMTVVARHQRLAHLVGDGNGEAFRLSDCDSWVIDGLHVSNRDLANGYGDTIGFYSSPRLIARNLLVEHPNRCGNDSALFVAGAPTIDAVVEDSEVYGFHRDGIIVYDTTSATVRRVFVHSRNTMGLPCYAETYPERGDDGILCYRFMGDTNCVVENVFAENVVAGFSDVDSRTLRVSGSIAHDAYFGAVTTSQVAPPSVRTSPVVVENFVAVGDDVGIWNRGVQLDASRVTLVGARARSDAAYGDGANADANGGTTATTLYRDVLSIENQFSGFEISGQASWLIDYSNAYGNVDDYYLGGSSEPIDDASGNVQHSMSVLPTDVGTTACLVYVPATSNMATAGSTGGPLGAQIIYELDGGVLTDRKLWNQRTGAFPCGAIVPSVNDIPGESCFDAHERVRVGVAGCAIP